MKIIILDGYTCNPGDLSWEGLENLGEVIVYDRTPADRNEIIRRIGDAEIIFTNKTVLDGETLKKCPSVKYIGVLATGYNVVDVDTAKQLGIVVTNIPGYGTDAVAQYAFALLLEICSRVGYHSKAVHEGKWSQSEDFCFWDYPLIELSEKTVGIIGFGRIGRAVGEIANGFHMQVLASGSRPTEEGKKIGTYVSLDELFERSDIIFLNCPLTSETKGIINKESIGKMREGVILINNGRGPLIIEEDLAEALKAGKVYAAGLDVVSKEPITKENPLLNAPNCFITPHISWAAQDTRKRLIGIAVDNLKHYLSGEKINVVI